VKSVLILPVYGSWWTLPCLTIPAFVWIPSETFQSFQIRHIDGFFVLGDRFWSLWCNLSAFVEKKQEGLLVFFW